MMTFNPSIGRVLARGSGLAFRRVMRRVLRVLPTLKNQEDFDRFHHRVVLRLLRVITHTAKRRAVSYGHAQKGVNVFLKVYVDWAKLPDRRTAARVARVLHVPLDTIVMGQVRREQRTWHEAIVARAYRAEGQRPSDLRLTIITHPMYLAWQQLFRRVRPRRPVDLDVIWSMAPRT